MIWLAAFLAVALAALAAFCGLFAWRRQLVAFRHPRILMYHMVSPPRPGARFNKLRVHPSAFERQLQWLVAQGWRFVFLSELSDEQQLTEKTVAITFDDGYRDNFLAAHPLLEKYGGKATLFLVADRIDRDWSVAKNPRHADGELRREPKLTDDDVRAMLASGVWELGAHTVTHPLLPSLDAAAKALEVGGAKTALEQRFGTPVESFAYPFGIFGDADRDAVAAAGYRWAVSTNAGVSTDLGADAHILRRIKVSGGDGLLAFRLSLRTGRRGVSK